MQPITPKEVIECKKILFPSEVFEAFNELIAENFDGKEAVIRQNVIVALMIDKGLSGNDIFKKHWLDVESIYETAGWIVTYDRPAYSESYEATFTFRIRV